MCNISTLHINIMKNIKIQEANYQLIINIEQLIENRTVQKGILKNIRYIQRLNIL